MTLPLGAIVSALAGRCAARLVGDPNLSISGLAPLDSAQPCHLSFLSHARHAGQLAHTDAGCVVVAPAAEAVASARGACLVVDDPYYYFALLTQFWKSQHAAPPVPGVHPSAFVDPTAMVHASAFVGEFVCIGAAARIDEGARVAEHCSVGAGARVGAGSRLSARVTLGDDCVIGERCLVHSGVVIGADGFGFALHEQRWEKIEQLGAVRIGDDVEIGANTCIDRGALLDTVIENGVKLDNLIQIGHNVHIGAHSALAGCVGIAGSALIGAHCTIGGGAIVLGHLRLADHVHVSAASVVTRSILQPGHYTGLFPIDDNAAWEKNAATLKQLHSLRDRLKRVENHIASSQSGRPA